MMSTTGDWPRDAISAALGELLRPTPSAVSKLHAAWNGLQLETQILILDHLSATDLPGEFAKPICLIALDHPNTYVRYLASVALYAKVEASDDREIIKAKIEADGDPLVRYSLLESPRHGGLGTRDLEDAERFFVRPREARLAMVRNLAGGGKQIGRIIEHGLRDGVVSDHVLWELLRDYVHNPNFQKHFRDLDGPARQDSSVEWETGQELEALWRLVPLLPTSLSKLLIKALPERAGLSFEVPAELLNDLTDEQTRWLLERPDIELLALRKDIALRHRDRNETVRLSAMEHNFDLTHEDFAALVFNPEQVRNRAANLLPLDLADQQKIDTLQELACAAKQLSPVYYEAIRGLLLETPLAVRGASHASAVARQRLQRWFEKLRQGPENDQRRELRLYRLAKEAAPWNKLRRGVAPSGKLSFLADKVKEGDTWATFTAFSEAWSDLASERLDKYLPRLHELGETRLADDDEESDMAKVVNAANQIEARLNDMLDILRQAENTRSAESITYLEKTLRAVEAEAVATRKALEPIDARLARTEKLDRIRLALFCVIAVLTASMVVINVW